MKARSAIVPIAFGLSLVGTFAAGRYVGAHDTTKLHAAAQGHIHAMDSAEKLWITHRAAEQLRGAKSGDALRVLDRYADLHAAAVAKCLGDAACSWNRGGLAHRAALQQIVDQRTSVPADKGASGK